MAKDRVSFLIDNDGNYAVSSGDFVIGDTRLQEAKLIILASQNGFKQHPLTGCNTPEWKDAAMTKQQAMRTIKQQLEADGLKYNDYQLLIESNA